MAYISKRWAILGISTASALALAIGCGVRERDPAEGAGANLSTSADLVISQVYGGGGNANSPYHNDFVELFNRGTTPVSLAGKSLQYTSANFPFAAGRDAVALPDAMLQPGQYFLLKLNGKVPPAATSVDGALGADGDVAITMSQETGKIAIVPTDTPLDDCGTIADSGVLCNDSKWIDLVGYGAASQAEGMPTAKLKADTALARKDSGCQDSGKNVDDFDVAAPAPRNSRSPVHVCAAVDLDAGADADSGHPTDPDAGDRDAGADSGKDASTTDAGKTDAGKADAGKTDAGKTDAGKKKDAAAGDDDDDDDDDGHDGSDQDLSDDPRPGDAGKKKGTTPLRTGSSDCSMAHGPVSGGGGFAGAFGIALALASLRTRRRSRTST